MSDSTTNQLLQNLNLVLILYMYYKRVSQTAFNNILDKIEILKIKKNPIYLISDFQIRQLTGIHQRYVFHLTINTLLILFLSETVIMHCHDVCFD